MSKGTPITDRVKDLIAEICKQNPGLYAKEIQVELTKRIERERLGKKHRVPGLSFIRDQRRKIRDYSSDLDKPFSLGALLKYSEYPIPPETLSLVLRVRAHRDKENEGEFTIKESFTIRDALWVARLSKLILDPDKIWSFVVWYSARERAYEAVGKDLDTTDLDEQLLQELKAKAIKSKHKKGEE
jgi:hypothetical protein